MGGMCVGPGGGVILWPLILHGLAIAILFLFSLRVEWIGAPIHTWSQRDDKHLQGCLGKDMASRLWRFHRE